jgi:hypothetical protein
LTTSNNQFTISCMKNNQINISIKYGNEVYKKNFTEYSSLEYIDFLESFGLWYEINEATAEELPMPTQLQTRNEDTTDEQQEIL